MQEPLTGGHWPLWQVLQTLERAINRRPDEQLLHWLRFLDYQFVSGLAPSHCDIGSRRERPRAHYVFLLDDRGTDAAAGAAEYQGPELERLAAQLVRFATSG